MKSTRNVLLLVAILAAGAAGYIGGLRRAFVLEHHDSLSVLPTVAMLLRENKPDLALRLTDSCINSSTLDLKRYEGLTSPWAVVGDMLGHKYTYYDVAFERTSQYLNHYPHPDISAPAIAYIEAQPESKTSSNAH